MRGMTGENYTVNLRLNSKQRDGVNAILGTGLYGNTPAACVMRLLDAKLIELLKL